MKNISTQKRYTIKLTRREVLDAIVKSYPKIPEPKKDCVINIFTSKGSDPIEITWTDDEENVDI